MKKGIIGSTIVAGVIIALIFTVSAAFAQDDMQDAKASFMGAGVKFKMDRPSMKARNLESANSEQVKEAREFKNMDNGILSGMFNGDGEGRGVRSRPIKDTKIICEVCKAKAVLNASENCEFCKGKPYADLCDKCIAWSILNACDACKAKIRGKAGKKEESAVKEEKAAEVPASEESVKAPTADEPADEITADEPLVEKETKKSKAKSKKKTTKKARAEKKAEPVVE